MDKGLLVVKSIKAIRGPDFAMTKAVLQYGTITIEMIAYWRNKSAAP